MNKTNEIKYLLSNVHDMPVSDELNSRLKRDVSLKKILERSVIRDWFAPSGETVSLRRAAYTVIITIVCLVPLGFGAAEIIKKFTVQEREYTYTEENRTEPTKKGPITVTSTVTTYGSKTSISGNNINSETDAKKAESKMIQFMKEGKAEKINLCAYRAVLPIWGEVVYETGGLPISILESENREEKIKEMYDEIERLRVTGNFESIFKKEVQKENGRKVRYYMERFTLSNGETMSMTHGYPVPQEDNKNNPVE